jgi:hypothetical protein
MVGIYISYENPAYHKTFMGQAIFMNHANTSLSTNIRIDA